MENTKDKKETPNEGGSGLGAFALQYLAPATSSVSSFFSNITGQDQSSAIDNAKRNADARRELLSTSTDDAGSSLRQRKTVITDNSDDILSRQQQNHERIAEEMLSLTRNLKHNISASGSIIRKDTKVLSQATLDADSNLTQLKSESNRLESHLQQGTNWWLWIALALVCVTFLLMIIFIRFFPKR